MNSLSDAHFRFERDFVPYWYALWFSVAVTVVGEFLVPLIGYHAIGFLFLAGIMLVGTIGTISVVVFTAGLSALAWDFFFIPPRFKFMIETREDLAMFITYFVVAVLIGLWRRRLGTAMIGPNTAAFSGRDVATLGVSPIGLPAVVRTHQATDLTARALLKMSRKQSPVSISIDVRAGAEAFKVNDLGFESILVRLVNLISGFDSDTKSKIDLVFSSTSPGSVSIDVQADHQLNVEAKFLNDVDRLAKEMNGSAEVLASGEGVRLTFKK